MKTVLLHNEVMKDVVAHMIFVGHPLVEEITFPNDYYIM